MYIYTIFTKVASQKDGHQRCYVTIRAPIKRGATRHIAVVNNKEGSKEQFNKDPIFLHDPQIHHACEQDI